MLVKKAYIIIPIYNEEKYIYDFLKSLTKTVKKIPSVKKILIINDGSTDKSLDKIGKIKKNGLIQIISLSKNKGKGAAMKKGLAIAEKEQPDCVIFMDGDGQHHPKYINTFLKKIHTSPIVFGYRLLSKDAPWARRNGNKVAGLIFRNLFKIKRKDLLCGLMAFRKDIFDVVDWTSNGYGVEAEIATVVGRKNISFSEVLVSTIYLDPKKGVNLKHAIRILLRIPFWYLKIK